MAKKLFDANLFPSPKKLTSGDKFVLNKWGSSIETVRIDFVWHNGWIDCDMCAFMLGEDGMIHKVVDLVYFNSRLRWKTDKPFDIEDFDPQYYISKGEFSTWAKEEKKGAFRNRLRWEESTFPVSADGSVIGPLDDIDCEGCCSETMFVRLYEVNTHKYASIVFAAAIPKNNADAGVRFKDTCICTVNIYDANTDELLAEYKLDQSINEKDVVRFGRIIYDEDNDLWSFDPMAIGDTGGLMYLATEVYN